MKNLFLIPALAFISLPAFSQEVEIWGDIPVIMDAFGHKIAPDGSFSSGEAVSADGVWTRDNISGEVFFFEYASCGDGNNITKDHVVVGTDMSVMKGAFLIPDGSQPQVIPSLSKYSESFLHGINWDGTRLVGFLSNPENGDMDEIDPNLQRMAYLPFYCDVDPSDLSVSDPVFLPVPKRDFFGLVPQYCTATWISDDGTTILGQVIDNSGSYIYPIVYKQAANGEWSMSLPSEKLFNPDNLEIPVWPQPAIAQPQAQDYIGNPEFRKLFEELLKLYLSGESTDDPFPMLNPEVAGDHALMTEEEWDEYSEAVDTYLNYMNTVYVNELDKYYEEYSRFISRSTRFLQSSLAMNRAGTLIGQTKIVTRFSGIDPITYLNPVVFNLENDSYTIYGEELSELEISQILPDGTLIGVSPKPGPTSPDLTPQHSYVCPPTGKTFVTIEDYIKSLNPGSYQWMQEYLRHEVPIGYDESGDIAYKDMTVTGLVAISDDFTVISGGVDRWSWNLDNGDYITYIISGLTPPDTGINEIPINDDSILKVFNLQGIKVLETRNPALLKSLSKGIYIINGKKVII